MSNILDSNILDVDSYKTGQWRQLPPNTKYMYSYIESRGGDFDRTLFFGLQMFILKYLTKPITMEDIDEAEEVISLHGVAFNRVGWQYILRNHNGYFPIEISAIPEGTVIPNKNVLITITNTDPNVPWIVSYIETMLLRAMWYPTTVASNSYHAKNIIMDYLRETSDNPGQEILFKLHDFGARGVSSKESAGIGGCAHLVNFMGSDTVTGLLYARRYYDARMAGFSINAMEHSTVTAWGPDNEVGAYSNMLDEYARPGAMLAAVSDSYDLWNAIKNIWGDTLRDRVKNSGACIVIRPDSGSPLTVPRDCINILGEKFGYTINNKGYRVLHPCVRVIQGDGININSISPILNNVKNSGYSTENLAMGMGGGLLQMVNRDNYKFAQKNSAIYIGDKWYDTFKNPIDDPTKASRSGKFAVIQENNEFKTILLHELNGRNNILRSVWRNGNLLIRDNFDTIRSRCVI